MRFDSNIGPGLPWKFAPEQTEISVKIGEVVTAYYTVTNQSARPTAGIAAYNVAPPFDPALIARVEASLAHGGVG